MITKHQITRQLYKIELYLQWPTISNLSMAANQDGIQGYEAAGVQTAFYQSARAVPEPYF